MWGRVLLGLVAVPFLLGAAAAPSGHDHVLFSFQDTRITESSGLIALGSGTGLFVTTNDSGDTGRVFVVDDRGRTVGITSWSDDAHDVEALAPAGPGDVWVGDIGDNRASRDSVQVTRVPVGRGDRDSDGPIYDLTYPDGSHDAETLLAAPDGRLYVVSKGMFGGTVYAAPAQLSADHANRLVQVADGILPMATDGAFLPDGRHVLIRGYAGAVLYSFPDFSRLAPVPLPSQPQGEGLAVATDGSIYLSSEGIGSDVLRLAESGLCSSDSGICARDRAASAQPSPDPATRQQPSAHPAEGQVKSQRGWWPWLFGGAVVAVIAGLQLRMFRRR
ncbi:WD40 repeat domain-containing protein [Nocardioides panacihumi]|uniref:WD40 repeat domain-containing protein n=1 Tax=Nocardioides panacihumi TaxID=400774 RepID=A0ABP5C417_9ACTN